MNNREHWTPDELAMQDAMDRVREQYPDFWKDLVPSQEEIERIRRKCDAEQEERDRLTRIEIKTTTKTREEKPRRRKRFLKIAVCVMLILASSITLSIFWSSDTAHAIRFEMEKKYYQAKGWIQATDPFDVNDDNMMYVIVKKEEDILQYKSFWDGLLIPQYLPEGYSFLELYIEKYISGTASAHYSYKNEEKHLNIFLRTYELEGNTQVWMKSKNVLDGKYKYVTWNDPVMDTSGIDIIMGDIEISISGHMDTDVLIDVANHLY